MAPSVHRAAAGGTSLGPEVEVAAGDERTPLGPHAPGPGLRHAVRETLSAAGVNEGHLAVALVSAQGIRALNRDHRGLDRPTDVLSFPVDEDARVAGPRELGDVVICPEHTDDLVRAAVHGVLHLLGHDHETDHGEMLALEDGIVAALS